MLERGGSPVRVAATPVAEVVDTNGAGDAFFAGAMGGVAGRGRPHLLW